MELATNKTRAVEAGIIPHVAVNLSVLRTAYPAQARNFGSEEAKATAQLWSIIFAKTEPELLKEAVLSFISHDRKAFFPSPGQIMAEVERVKNAKRMRGGLSQEEWEKAEREILKLRTGENIDDFIRPGTNPGHENRT